MKQVTAPSLDGYWDGDVDTNRSTASPHLNDLVAQRYSRRQTLFGGLGAMTTAVFGAALLAGCGDGGDDRRAVTVEAGNSGATTSGRTVTLTGTVTGGTGSNTGFTQTGGPAVTLTSDANGNATFIAPAVTTAQTLTFDFRSTSSDGITSLATTSVSVAPATLGFTAVSKSLADVVAVPAGYRVNVLYRLGDPNNGGVAAYANDGNDTNFAARAGDHHDGMSFFGLAATGTVPDPSSSSRGLLVLNHENITQAYLHANGATTVGGVRTVLAEVIKEVEAHGVSVVEIARGSSGWAYVPNGALNRRITPFTVTSFSGPVRGSTLLRTAYSPTGVAGRGTINNCANGYMPWNTYLTCEENWAGYFRREVGDNSRRAAALGDRSVVAFTRYGLATGTGDTLRAGNYNWATAAAQDERLAKFNATTAAGLAADGSADFRNEPNQFGWVTEIDPYSTATTVRKRTALGRMNHEGCQIGRTIAGVKPAFYMGDDAQNEYIYKFVAATPWSAADASTSNRLATGDKYLDSGTLYVARFNADGSGAWLPLVFGQGVLTSTGYPTYAFQDQADVLTQARLAGDALGATRMDRPEWTAVNPANGEMYCTLTNNALRTPGTTDAANPRAFTDPKLPQGDVVNADPPTTAQATRGNANGHVIRLRETGDTTEAVAFTWDIYAFGSGADLNPATINLSGLDATNDFSSPDGLWFARASNPSGQGTPLLWIETDDVPVIAIRLVNRQGVRK